MIVYDAVIDNDRRQNAFGLLMSLNMLIETPGGFDYTGADVRAGCVMPASVLGVRNNNGPVAKDRPVARGISNPWSHHAFAPLTRAHANRFLYRRNEDLAVADFARTAMLADHVDDLVDLRVAGDDLDLHLG